MKYRIALSLTILLAGVLFGLALAQPAAYAAPAIQTPDPLPLGMGPDLLTRQVAEPVQLPFDYGTQVDVIGQVVPAAAAVINLMDTYNERLDDEARFEIVTSVIGSARTYEVDPLLIAAVITHESSFRPRAVSRCGARGLMQLHPRYHWASFDAAMNVNVGTAFLARMIKKYDGRYDLALAGYNAGPDRAEKALREYRETRAYVRKVLRTYRRLREGAGGDESALHRSQ